MSSAQPASGRVTCFSAVPSVPTVKIAPCVLASSSQRRNAIRPGGSSLFAVVVAFAGRLAGVSSEPQPASAIVTASAATQVRGPEAFMASLPVVVGKTVVGAACRALAARWHARPQPR